MTQCRRLLVAMILFAWPLAASAEDLIDTPAKQAILMEHASGTVLFAKNAEFPAPPSSMSKLMTLYLLFERLSDGRLGLEDSFKVSEKAWRMGGSKMFVAVGHDAKIEDLIRGIVVQSGNDACIVVAEGISGSEKAFADLMNRRAREIGLKDSHFINASGWPEPGHVMSARDLAVLAKRLIDDFPQYYHYFQEKTFTYSEIRQGNRNPLLYKNIGADGLKTGHTEAAGFGLVASAIRDGRRLVLVVNGLESVNQRSRESERLLNWGFREFGSYSLFKAGEVVEEADVWLGSDDVVPLIVEAPVEIIMARRARKDLEVSVQYASPLPAPISKGDQLATLRVTAPGLATVERPLLAGADVDQLGVFGRLGAAIEYLLFGGVSPQ